MPKHFPKWAEWLVADFASERAMPDCACEMVPKPTPSRGRGREIEQPCSTPAPSLNDRARDTGMSHRKKIRRPPGPQSQIGDQGPEDRMAG